MEDYITLALHGGAKVGKTYFSTSGPGRTLILDAEAGGMRFVPGKKITWNVEDGEDIPSSDGDWKICRVPVTRPQTVAIVRDFLMTGQHPFNNVAVDSLTEIQDVMKRARSATFELEQRDWGAIFGTMNEVVVSLRDLVSTQDHVKSFVVVTGTHLKDGMFRPMIAGQFGQKLPYKLDAIGYLHKTRDEANNVRRVLLLGESQTHEVGNRLGDTAPDELWEPTIPSLLNAVFGTKYKEDNRDDNQLG